MSSKFETKSSMNIYQKQHIEVRHRAILIFVYETCGNFVEFQNLRLCKLMERKQLMILRILLEMMLEKYKRKTNNIKWTSWKQTW